MTKVQKQISKMCLAALFLALGWLMPFITGQIQDIGNMFLPMHLPVIIAGFVLGPWYGLLIGVITPLTRSLIFGMPPIFPMATSMAFELGTYGLVSGFIFYTLFKRTNINIFISIFAALISAMLLGRCVYGLVMYIFTFINTNIQFNFNIFLGATIVKAWPGILIQLGLVPSLVFLLYKSNLLQKYIN